MKTVLVTMILDTESKPTIACKKAIQEAIENALLGENCPLDGEHGHFIQGIDFTKWEVLK